MYRDANGMGHNGGMGGKITKFDISRVLLVLALCGAAAAALWALKSNQAVGYWLAGAGVVLPIVQPLIRAARRQVARQTRRRLDIEAAVLRKALLEQWEGEIKRRVGHPYPLPVPFAVSKQAKDVMDGWKAIRSDEKAVALPMKGKFEDITEVFTKPGMPPKLVVLGKPGTGKSTIAQWLMLKLLTPTEEAERDGREENRVPFFLPLATWDPADPLQDWVAAKMIETYPNLGNAYASERGEERTLARELVAQHRVLMILDGLDEMVPRNQGRALDKLSDAAQQGQGMVLTCRTEEYQKIVKKARNGPLRGAPVIELGPLPMPAVRTYLSQDRAQADGRWDELLGHLAKEPRGPVATALSTPLAVWLARTVYGNTGADYGSGEADGISERSGAKGSAGDGEANPAIEKPAKRPSDLIHEDDSDQILRTLLGGLVEAAYAPATEHYPERVAPKGSRIDRHMVSVAKHTAAQDRDRQNIDWWRLHEICPRIVIGLEMGLIVGPLLGAAAGVAVTVKAGHQAGLALGIAFAIVTGALAGITCARPQLEPRAVTLAFTWERLGKWLPRCVLFGAAVGAAFAYADYRHGGLIAALITAAAAGPTAAWSAMKAFEFWPGLTAGVTAALAIGLAAGLASGHPGPLIAGPIAGLVFMTGAWVWIGAYAPAHTTMAVNPQSLLKNDREGCIVVGVTAGLAFGVVFGLALGLGVGIIAVVALTIVVTLVVSLWGTFMVARLWLATRSGLPLQLMAFLNEAYERGVLRQDGPHYQFRHLLLHEQLAGVPIRPDDDQAKEPPEAAGSPRSARQGAVTST
jgi:hypothetical protein